MKCLKCGTENKDDAKKCANCGFVFDYDNSLFELNEQTINAEEAHKQTQIDEIKKRRIWKKRKKKIQKVLLAIVIAALCAGAVYGAYYLSKQNDIKFNNNEILQASESPTPTPTEEAPATPTPTVMPTPEATPTAEPTESASQDSENTMESVEATKKPQSSSVKADTDTTENTDTETTKPVKATAAPKATKSPAKTSSAPKATKKPAANPALTSAFSMAGETITDEEGKQYSTIVTNGKIVYLEVSTPLENNSYSIISAKDTGRKINNLPIYEPSSVTAVNTGDYILPQSSVKLLTNDDIKGLSKQELKLARNEIYARHGRTFKDASLNAYFSSKSWYSVNPSYKYNNDELNVTDIENKNAHFLLDIENSMAN